MRDPSTYSGTRKKSAPSSLIEPLLGRIIRASNWPSTSLPEFEPPITAVRVQVGRVSDTLSSCFTRPSSDTVTPANASSLPSGGGGPSGSACSSSGIMPSGWN